MPRSAPSRLDVTVSRVSQRTRWITVRLLRPDGAYGFGEATLDAAADDVIARLHAIARSIDDADSAIGAATTVALARAARAKSDLAGAAVACALDHARFDLMARDAARPLAAHLGGTMSSIPLYANINRSIIDRSPEGFAYRAADAMTAGFTRIKIAPFDGLVPGSRDALLYGAGLTRIAATREAVGPNVALMIDCHWRFAVDDAITLIEDLKEVAPDWIECPLPEDPEHWHDIHHVRRAANQHGMRLAGAEKLTSPEAFGAVLAADCYDVVMPDVKYAGAPDDVLRIAETARARGTAISLHNPSGPVAHLVSLAVTSAIGAEEPLEHQFAEVPNPGALVGIDGLIGPGVSTIPSAAGLGIDALHCAGGAGENGHA